MYELHYMDNKVWKQMASTRIWYFRIIHIRGELFSCVFQNCCITFFSSITKMWFSYQGTFFFFTARSTTWVAQNTHIMLPSCDWYLIPLYTNIHKQKLPAIFVIVLHREFLFPLPAPCLQTACPAALWPLRKSKPTDMFISRSLPRVLAQRPQQKKPQSYCL